LDGKPGFKFSPGKKVPRGKGFLGAFSFHTFPFYFKRVIINGGKLGKFHPIITRIVNTPEGLYPPRVFQGGEKPLCVFPPGESLSFFFFWTEIFSKYRNIVPKKDSTIYIVHF